MIALQMFHIFLQSLPFLGVSVHPCLMGQSASKLGTLFWEMAMPGSHL